MRIADRFRGFVQTRMPEESGCRVGCGDAADGTLVQEKSMSKADDWRIDHTGIGVSDIQRSARFYDAALGALGLSPVMRITKTFKPADSGATPDLGGVGYGVAYPVFWIDVFHPYGVKQHTAFRARSREEVRAFHSTALSSGGKDNGKPGLREAGHPPGYYAAFVLDPDGNNIEAVFREG
ncbi:MAG TPA: VOC family protein [Rhizomicrobium sp.]